VAKRKTKSTFHQVRRTKKPRSAEQYFARPKRQQNALLNAARALTAMRNEKISLTTAAVENNVSATTIKRLAGSNLRKSKKGVYKVRSSDTMLRVLVLPQDGKLVDIATRDSRSATLASGHANAMHQFLATGDSSELMKYEGMFVTDAQGHRIPLLTDLDELERLGSAGVLSYQSLYARAA
jgi:hypothetical protein